MRILALNLRAGGNAVTVPQVVRRAAYLDIETAVFSEYRENRAGALLRAELEKIGLTNQAFTASRGNGVLIASAEPFDVLANPFGLSEGEYPHAVLFARFEHLQMYGAYLPGQDRKRVHLRCLTAAAKRHNDAGDMAMCIGDLNSGRNETDIEINLQSGRLLDWFSTADLYAELEREWTEAWAHLHAGEYDFSWYPYGREGAARGGGWRIDKAFVSPRLLPSLRAAEYDHAFRLDQLSDHSGLLVELVPPKKNKPGYF
ncbi:MAG: endonuclease/exonuclease/phosphatase family protein [Candidatus Cybelea sp.]